MRDDIAILQFGTSRLLQAHADLFVGEARSAGQNVGRIAVVQSTGSPRSKARIHAFRTGQPYRVQIRGIQDGKTVDRFVTTDAVATGLDAGSQWEEVRALSRTTSHFVSNVGDRAYAPSPADRLNAEVPLSFPAKLLDLLHLRFRDQQTPPVILPCELRATGNGRMLRQTLVDLARTMGHQPAFVAWLAEECIFANTLVDRIVTGDLNPVGAVTEPFALWAIKDQAGVSAPFNHPAVDVSDRYDEHVRLKLYLLNVGHLVMLQACKERGKQFEISRQALTDPFVAAELQAAYDEELLPTFALAGMGAKARRYVAITRERMLNPFLDHRLADMQVDLAAKIRERVGGFLNWSNELGAPPRQKRLLRLMAAGSVSQ